jgi:CheY-like chemotaxis protein
MREALSCPIITSLRASDMVAHERMRSLGEITVTNAPTAPEEVVRLASKTPSIQEVSNEKLSLSVRNETSPCRILVADDTPTSRLIIREMLEEAGYEVETVENGQALVERVQSDARGFSDCPISAILTDIEMPILGGVEAAQLIRELERENTNGKRFPIIAITAHALLDEQARFKSAGIDHVVTKPLRPADLDAALSTIFGTVSNEPSRQAGVPYPPVSMESALRDLTHRLWQEVAPEHDESPDTGVHDGIDINDVFERSGDSPRRTKLMLNAFLGSYHDPLSKLRDISDPRALKDLTRAAHSMRGMLLDVGAKYAADLAETLEQSLMSGDTVDAARYSETLTREATLIATLVERVVRHFPSHEAA